MTSGIDGRYGPLTFGHHFCCLDTAYIKLTKKFSERLRHTCTKQSVNDYPINKIHTLERKQKLFFSEMSIGSGEYTQHTMHEPTSSSSMSKAELRKVCYRNYCKYTFS